MVVVMSGKYPMCAAYGRFFAVSTLRVKRTANMAIALLGAPCETD
jgi:hypothetical protein